MLVRVHAAGVDQGVWHLMAGLPYLVAPRASGFARPKTRVRGMDVAGRVEAVGADVTRFRPGDEVFGIVRRLLRRVRVRPRGQARAQAGEPHLRAGRGRPDLGLRRPPGLRDTGKVQRRAAGADHRRGRRRGDVRRAAGQGVRRRGHRRVQHHEDRTWSDRSAPTTSSTTRARTSPTAAALRPDPRHRRQPPAVTPAARPRAAGDARHRRRRRRRTVARRHRPPAPRARCCRRS